MYGKEIYNFKDVEQQISNGKIYLDEKAILASSLQDYIREHNIEVVYGGETCSVKTISCRLCLSKRRSCCNSIKRRRFYRSC